MSSVHVYAALVEFPIYMNINIHRNI